MTLNRVVLDAVLIPLGCLAAAAASADDMASRWAFGSQIGWAQGGSESAQLTGELSTLSYDVAPTFGDKSRLGWRVFTGYRFTDYLAVHVGYTDLGKVEAERADWFAEASGEQTIRGVDVGMQLKVPLSERVALEFRGGNYYWQSRTHTADGWGESFRVKRRDSDVFFGAGVELALVEEFTATLGWTRYEVAGAPVAFWTVGALYRFSMY